jgi:hypothetical protein
MRLPMPLPATPAVDAMLFQHCETCSQAYEVPSSIFLEAGLGRDEGHRRLSNEFHYTNPCTIPNSPMKAKTTILSAILSSLFIATASAATYRFDFGTPTSDVQTGWTGITHNAPGQNDGTALQLVGGGSPTISVAYPAGQTLHHRDRGTGQFTLGAADPNVSLLRDILYFDGMSTSDDFTFTIAGLAPNQVYEVWGYAVDMFSSTTNDNKSVRWTTNGGNVTHTTDSANEDLAFARFQMANMTADGSGEATILAEYVAGGSAIILFNGFEISQIPEPSAAFLGGLGLIILLRRRR